MAQEFIRIPPDSTGKRITHNNIVTIAATSVVYDLTLIELEDEILGATSGVIGKFSGFDTVDGVKYIYLFNQNGDFTVGEILKHNGVNVATVMSVLERYTPNINIADKNIPSHTLSVDSNGSAYVRYSEGDLVFDAFGKAQFSQTSQIANHFYTYGDQPERYYDYTNNGGLISGVTSESALLLSVNNLSGSTAQRTSNQYYPYNPGEGNEIMLSLKIGDNGKTNCVRRWGLFDNNDGLFFELSGTTLSVVIRSTTTGTITEDRIPRTEFNGSQLSVGDGSLDASLFELDFSKFNLYWIDYQWLGVGRVRFGTYAPNGKRITMHTFRNPNQNDFIYTKRGTLPLGLEIKNVGSTASSSEMKLGCVSVERQGGNLTFPGKYYTITSNEVNVNSLGYSVLISGRPNLTHEGQINRTSIIPVSYQVYVDGDPVKIDLVMNSTLSGSTFAETGGLHSSTSIDKTATGYTGGTVVDSFMFGSGVNEKKLNEELTTSLTLGADGVTQPIFSLVAKTLKTSGSSKVVISVKWKETR